MKFLFCLLLGIAVSSAATSQPIVEVFIPSITGYNMNSTDLTFARALTIVTEIYADIGIKVVWRSTRSAPSGCSKSPLHGKIVVAFRAANTAQSDAALAFSNPFSKEGPCVTVLMDRLKPEGERNMLRVGYLLGHALAHEIGHVLQGFSRHSESGLMKAQWSMRDVMNMSRKTLLFTRYDAELVLTPLGVSSVLRAGDSMQPRQPVDAEDLALLSKAK